MELVIPFMLLLLQSPDSDPSQFELTRHPALFSNEQECLKKAQELEVSVTAYFCKPVPEPAEYERLFDEMDAARRAPAEAESE